MKHIEEVRTEIELTIESMRGAPADESGYLVGGSWPRCFGYAAICCAPMPTRKRAGIGRKHKGKVIG